METVNGSSFIPSSSGDELSIAGFIDHTVLRPVTTRAEVDRCCAEAREKRFAAVCIPPYAVGQAVRMLQGSGVKTATVIGFPMGYSVTSAKLDECQRAITDGAEELDVVVNLMALKDGDWNYVTAEIAQLTDAIHTQGRIIKVIVESGLLLAGELLTCCRALGQLGIDFMKTSTGYADKGASVESVQTMRRELPAAVAIKASGGIRSYSFARQLIEAGAGRIGCSGSLQILAEEKASLLTVTNT